MEKVYFVTNRQPDDTANPTDFGKDFSADGVANLRYGYAKVSGRKFDKYEVVVAEEQLNLDKDKGCVAPGSVFGSQAIMAQVRKEMTETQRPERYDCFWSTGPA